MNRLKRAVAGTLFYKNTVSLALLLIVCLVAYTVYDNMQARERATQRANSEFAALKVALSSLETAQVQTSMALRAAEDARQDVLANRRLLRQLVEQNSLQLQLIVALRQQLIDAGISPVAVAAGDPQPSPSPRPTPGPSTSPRAPPPTPSPRPTSSPSPYPTPSPSQICLRQPPLPQRCIPGG